MKYRTILILTVFFSLLRFDLVKGEEEITAIPKALPRQPIVKQINCLDGTEMFEFANGMTLFLKNDPSASEGTVRLLIRKTGSTNEQDLAGSGISHLVEQLLINSRSKINTASEIRGRFSRLGAVEKSFTDYEMTGFSIGCVNENIIPVLDLFVEQICNADLNQKEFDMVKRRLRNGFAVWAESRREQGELLLRQTCYLQHPMRHPIYGWQSLFENLSLADATRFYRQRYCPNNFIFAISGRLDREKILEKFQLLFGNKERRMDAEISLQYEQNQIAPRFSAREMEGELSDLYFAWPTSTGASREIYPLKLLAALLVDGEGSRLNRKYKEEKQYILSAKSICYNPQVIRGFFAIHAQVYPAETEMFKQGLLAELERIKTEPISDAELFRARKKVESDFLINNETQDQRLDRKMRSYLLTGNPDFENQFLREIKEVTSEKIQQTVQRYFRKECLSEVMICSKGLIPSSIDSSRRSDKDRNLIPEISAFHCKNQMRLILKRVPHLGFINISVFILSGTHLDSDENAGRAAILSRMLLAGTGEYSRTAITHYFDSIGGKFSVTATGNMICVSATVLREDCMKTVQLLAGCLSKQEYLLEEFERAKKEVLTLIRSENSRAVDELWKIFRSKLPVSTPLRFPPNGTEHSIGNLTIDNMREYGNGILSSHNMIFSVFGDIPDNYSAKDLEEATLALTESKNRIMIPFDRPNDIKDNIDYHQQTNKRIGAGLIAWPTVSAQKDDEYLALLILKTYLTGRYNYNGLLHRRIIDRGLAYLIVSEQQETPVPAYFFIYFETIPERLTLAIEAIEKEMSKICEIGISEEDFELAKQELIASFPQKNKTLEEQAKQAALDDMYFNNYERFPSLAEKVRNIRLEFIMDVVRRNMARKNIIITTSPLPKR